MNSKKEGFTLIELLIVIAIIGILSAIAIAVYGTQYKIKARLVEVTNVMSTVASALGAYYHDNNFAWPAAIGTHAGIRDSLGVNIPEGRIVATNGLQILANGIIQAEVDNIDTFINNKGLQLIPSIDGMGAIIWRWGPYNGTPEIFIPKK